jgi:predicted RNase H-like HicB family nuclease
LGGSEGRPKINYRVLLHPIEDGCFVAEVPELPGCISQGKTELEARANIEEAIAAWLRKPGNENPSKPSQFMSLKTARCTTLRHIHQ